MDHDSEPAEINPLIAHAVERIVAGWAQAFDELFSRPDAAETIEGYLAGRIHFLLDRDGVSVLVPDQPGAVG